MMRNTHIAAGVCAGLAVTGPAGLLQCASAALAGACGGAICDIDADKSWIRQKAGPALKVAALAAAMAGQIAAIRYPQTGIGPRLAMTAVACALCAFGMHTSHRSCMHSLLMGILLAVCVYVMLPGCAKAFLAGFLSHVALDLLNRKGVRVFWPLQKGICLHLCSADGLANKALCVLSIGLTVLIAVGYSGIIPGLPRP